MTTVPAAPFAGAASHASAPPALVFVHLLGGAVGFVLLALWTFLGSAGWQMFYAAPPILAWVHLAVLAWINPVMIGVLFQFSPVALGNSLHSEKLAWWQVGLYAFGSAGLILCFAIGRLDWPLHSFGTFLWVGLFLFFWNMLATFRGSRERDLTTRFLYAGLWYLLVTILLGLFLSVQIAYPMLPVNHLQVMKVHAHTGLIGWFLFVVIGVSLKLLPMFAMAHRFSERPARLAFYFLNAGLILWSTDVLLTLHAGLRFTGALLLICGLAAYLWQVRVIFRHRSAPGKKLDTWLRFAGGACAFLLIGTGMGAVLAMLPEDHAWQHRWVLAYGAVFFLGFMSLFIQSFLYRIVPFLVWLHTFSRLAGRQPVPRVADLLPAQSGVVQLTFHAAGSALIIAALLVASPLILRIGAGLMLTGGILFAWNLASVWHRARGYRKLAEQPEQPKQPVTLSWKEAR